MLLRYALLIALICTACTVPLLTQNEATKSYVEIGPFAVQTIDTLALADRVREREVVTKVYYPVGSGPFPVIVFSHGLGGNKDAFSVISRHWASHGYVAVHPTHDDRGVAIGAGGMNPPAEKVMDRVRDVKAVVDGLNQIEDKVPALRGKLDRGKLGIAGHSYGSFITMLLGGVTADIGTEKNKSVADARVKCVVPIAPGGRGDYGLTDDSWKSLKMPAFVITGTLDIRNGRPVEWRQEPYQFSPAGDKYLMVIAGANHSAYGNEATGNPAPTYVKTASVAFWDACLEKSARARTYLNGPEGFRAFAGSAATLSAK